MAATINQLDLGSLSLSPITVYTKDYNSIFLLKALRLFQQGSIRHRFTLKFLDQRAAEPQKETKR